MLETLVFYLFSGVLVGASIAILLSGTIVRAAVWLMAALAAVAGLFALLDATFVAMVQLLVYVGGVLVLIVFGVMLTSRPAAQAARPSVRDVVVAGGVGIVLFGGLLAAQLTSDWPDHVLEPARDGAGGIRVIGRELLTSWLVPFELVSVLLLAVMIGAAYLARPSRAAS